MRPQPKLSSEFVRRLDKLQPTDRVQAVLMLGVDGGEASISGRQSAERRAAAINAIRKSAEKILPEIDRILETHHGRRLSERPDALGSIAVDTTAGGIRALAELEPVKVILEDQPFKLFSPANRAIKTSI